MTQPAPVAAPAPAPATSTSTQQSQCRIQSLRKGLALPAAIFTLAVIALFIAGSAFATTQEA